jgi:hypothetical protein
VRNTDTKHHQSGDHSTDHEQPIASLALVHEAMRYDALARATWRPRDGFFRGPQLSNAVTAHRTARRSAKTTPCAIV